MVEQNSAENKQKKVVVDAQGCIGCGACIAITQEYGIFDFDDDGKSYVKKQPSNDKEIEATQESIDACCVAAIKWED